MHAKWLVQKSKVYAGLKTDQIYRKQKFYIIPLSCLSSTVLKIDLCSCTWFLLKVWKSACIIKFD